MTEMIGEVISSFVPTGATICPDVSPDAALGIINEAEEVVDEHGVAAILVDDVGLLLRSTMGPSVQARLTAVAVDGRRARDIGVLLAASYTDALSRTGLRGSPIADAANRYLSMPLLTGVEVTDALVSDGETPTAAAALVERCGAHLALIDQLRTAGETLSDADISQTMLQAVAGLHAGGANRVLDLARRDRALPTTITDSELSPLVWQASTDRTRLCPALIHAGMADLVPGGRPSWPSEPAASALRFRARTYGAPEALWFDRYFGSGLAEFMGFIDRIAQTSGAFQLRLLGSHDGLVGLPTHLQERFCERLRSWSARGLQVSWRLVQDEDFAALHDRQIVFPQRLDGYHLPPCDRITGRHAVGNENDAYLPRAPVATLMEAWHRATPFLQ